MLHTETLSGRLGSVRRMPSGTVLRSTRERLIRVARARHAFLADVAAVEIAYATEENPHSIVTFDLSLPINKGM